MMINERMYRGVGTKVAALLAVLAMLAAACGTPSEVAPTTGAPPADGEVAARQPVTTKVELAPILETPELVGAVADELDVPSANVAVVSDEAVTWSDGSLGCPEPQMGYTQALVEGRRVILEIDGLTYTYHSALEGGFFLCTKPRPPASITPPTTGVPVPPAEILTTAHAITALAARLGVGEAAISVVAEEEVTWGDGSIGCPQPGTAYTQALVGGRRVVLRSGGVDYHYHGAGTGPLSYCANPSSPSVGGLGDV